MRAPAVLGGSLAASTLGRGEGCASSLASRMVRWESEERLLEALFAKLLSRRVVSILSAWRSVADQCAPTTGCRERRCVVNARGSTARIVCMCGSDRVHNRRELVRQRK